MTMDAALLRFYLQGREDASDRFGDETDYDAEDLVERVSWQNLHHDLLDFVTRDIAVEKPELSPEAERMIRHEGQQGSSSAYDAWCKGFVDELTCILEAEVVNELVEIAEDDTAVETPAAKSKAKTGVRANPYADRSPEYADWYRTGISDCENTFDVTDFDHLLGDAVTAFQKHRQDVTKLAADVVRAYWQETGDDSKKEWMRQHQSDVKDEGLRPDRAYEFWADGWRLQAQSFLADAIVDRSEK